MRRHMHVVGAMVAALLGARMLGATEVGVHDLPTRPGVTQRILLLEPNKPTASVILFSGGDGDVGIRPDGSVKHGGNFLVRTRQAWADHGFVVAVVDPPSDRQSAPYLSGFRQSAEHAADIKTVIAFLRQRKPLPVWLIGTSRGTQSAAAVAVALKDGGPDGLVLTSTILRDPLGRAVPAMPVDTLAIPVLVLHHQDDGCRLCPPGDLAKLMRELKTSTKELVMVKGGRDKGDPCEAWAHHGYNGIEREVVGAIADWIRAHSRQAGD